MDEYAAWDYDVSHEMDMLTSKPFDNTVRNAWYWVIALFVILMYM